MALLPPPFSGGSSAEENLDWKQTRHKANIASMKAYRHNIQQVQDACFKDFESSGERINRSSFTKLQRQVWHSHKNPSLVWKVAVARHAWTFSAYKQLDLNVPGVSRIDMKIGPMYPEDSPRAVAINEIDMALPASWAQKLVQADILGQFVESYSKESKRLTVEALSRRCRKLQCVNAMLGTPNFRKWSRRMLMASLSAVFSLTRETQEGRPEARGEVEDEQEGRPRG